jgi:hypothetical protein
MARARALAQPEAAPPPPPGHNGLSPEEREAVFLSHLQLGRQDNKMVADAMAVVKGLRKNRNIHRNQAKQDGFSLALMDEIFDDETKGGRATMEQREADRRWMREVAGLPIGVQQELFRETPIEVQDEVTSETAGYQAGIRGAPGTPPAEIHPRHHPNWMKGWNNGQERNAWALAERGKIVDRDKGAGQNFRPSAPTGDDDVDDPKGPAAADALASELAERE